MNADDIKISFEGHRTDLDTTKVSLLTITSRHKFESPLHFRTALYEFLSSIKYPSSLKGLIEQGSTTGYHCHCITAWHRQPTGNRQNKFFFHLKPIDERVKARFLRGPPEVEDYIKKYDFLHDFNVLLRDAGFFPLHPDQYDSFKYHASM